MNPKVKLFLRIFVSILLIFLLYRKVHLKNVAENLRRVNPWVLPLVFASYFFNYYASAFRWRALFYKKSEKLTIFYLLKLYYIGAFLSNFLPSTVGGDVYKAYKLGKDSNHMSGAIVATFMDRLVGVSSLAIISSVGLVVMWGVRGLIVFFLFWVLTIAGFAGLWFLSKFSKKLKVFYELILKYKDKKKVLLKAFLYSLLVQFGSVFSHFFTAFSLGVRLSLPFSFFAFPIIGFVSFLPISFSGLGIQDNAYVLFFEYVGIPSSLAASASILYHLLRIINSLIGWVFLTFDPAFRGSLSLDFRNEGK